MGEDQKQHVELTRDIAERFNRLYGETFVVPQPVIPEAGARVMGLDDPAVKMSKSYNHIRGHAVRMLDEPKEIERAIMRAVTDSGSEIGFSNDPEQGGREQPARHLQGDHAASPRRRRSTTSRTLAATATSSAGVAEVVIEELTPIRERHEQLMRDPAELDRLLAIGAEQARAYAGPKVEQMKRAMGLTVPS